MQKALSLTIISVIFSCVVPNLALANPLVAQSSNKFPSVNSAQIYPDINLIWSQVVQVKDPFEGEYLAIFDRNDIYLSDKIFAEVTTVWTRQKITVLASSFYDRYGSKVSKLSLKFGDRIFNLDGNNSTFEINDDLAMALANAPSDKNATIRLVFDTGMKIDSAIGQGTVKAWNTLYQLPKPSP